MEREQKSGKGACASYGAYGESLKFDERIRRKKWFRRNRAKIVAACVCCAAAVAIIILIAK